MRGLVTRSAAACLAAVGLAVVSATAAQPDPVRLSAGQMKDLGWVHANEQSDFFLRVDPAKAPGVLRIGVFGESNAAGVEVGDGEAFPAMLEREFRRRGVRNVQVVSFAVGGYGAHQSHMLWRAAARDYGLDVVVFCFRQFLPERDTAFLTPWSVDRGRSEELHSRYVAEGGRLRLAGLPGADREDMVRRYWSWLPDWTEARYSRIAPRFLRRLLPRGRQWVSNPFYHDRGRTVLEEALETYRLIVQDLSRSVPAVVVWHDPRWPDEAFRKTVLLGQADNVQGLESRAIGGRGSRSDLRSLFTAANGHFSAVTHRNVARELFAFLTGDPVPALESYRWVEPRGAAAARGAVRPLSAYGRVRLSLAGRGLLSLHPLPARARADLPFGPGGAASLLLLRSPQPLSYALDSPLTDGETLAIELASGRRRASAELGRISARDPAVGRVELSTGPLEALFPDGRRARLDPVPAPAPQTCWEERSGQRLDRASVRVGGGSVVEELSVRREGGRSMLCWTHARAWVLRLAPGAYGLLQELTRRPAPLEFSLEGGGASRRILLAEVSREERPCPIAAPRAPILRLRRDPSDGLAARLSRLSSP